VVIQPSFESADGLTTDGGKRRLSASPRVAEELHAKAPNALAIFIQSVWLVAIGKSKLPNVENLWLFGLDWRRGGIRTPVASGHGSPPAIPEFQNNGSAKPAPRVNLPQPHVPGYVCFHRALDLRVSVAALANTVASGSLSKTRSTISGESQARWIRLLT
jgi:hypothetical protein